MTPITVDLIMSHRPCAGYPRERVEALFGGRKSVSLLEALDADVPPEDLVWLATTPWVLTPLQRDAWLSVIVGRAVRQHALRCGIPTVEQWARNWLSGIDRSAYSSYNAAVCVAALRASAAYCSVHSVIWNSYSLYCSATTWAAYAAPNATTERRQQITDLKQILGALPGLN
jgi:hypothetical protein